jgi:hypothetical protein
MKRNIKDKVIKAIGVIFLFIGLFSVLYAILRENYEQILWLCYIAIILLGYGIITKNKNLIISQISIQTIPIIFWNIDFFYYLLNGQPLWGITNYFFDSGHPLIAKIISLQHIYIIPISIFTLLLMKFNRQTRLWEILKIAYVQMILIFILGRMFTSPATNMNCVFYNCLPFETIIPYEVLWFIFVFLGISISALIYDKIFRKL